jgi:hypothetical protein
VVLLTHYQHAAEAATIGSQTQPALQWQQQVHCIAPQLMARRATRHLLTVYYCACCRHFALLQRIGNSGGLGGAFGFLWALGVPFPYPEGKPWTASWQQWVSLAGWQPLPAHSRVDPLNHRCDKNC